MPLPPWVEKHGISHSSVRGYSTSFEATALTTSNGFSETVVVQRLAHDQQDKSSAAVSDNSIIFTHQS